MCLCVCVCVCKYSCVCGGQLKRLVFQSHAMKERVNLTHSLSLTPSHLSHSLHDFESFNAPYIGPLWDKIHLKSKVKDSTLQVIANLNANRSQYFLFSQGKINKIVIKNGWMYHHYSQELGMKNSRKKIIEKYTFLGHEDIFWF